MIPRWTLSRRLARRIAGAVFAALAATLALVACEAHAATASHRWPREIVDVAATLPLQEGGRVMPLATFAEYTVLQWNGRRSVRYEIKDAEHAEGETIPATEILLDVMFRPEAAQQHPLFVVDNDEVLDAIGLAHEKKQKRDRYSIAELADRAPQLFELAARHRKTKPADRTPVEDGIVELADHVESFIRVRSSFPFADAYPSPSLEKGVAGLFPGVPQVRLLDVAAKATWLSGEAKSSSADRAVAARAILKDADDRASGAGDLRFFPPAAPRAEEPMWLSEREILEQLLQGGSISPRHAALLAEFERCARAADEPGSAGSAFKELHDHVAALADARGEYDKVGLEVALASLNPFGRALIGYLLAFVLAAATWLFRSRSLSIVAWSVLLLTLALHVAGIVIRCVIRNRPPMLNLYDTTLFVSAVVVAAACVVEMWTRLRIALAMAPLAGAILLFVSQGYETILADDTMRPPIAVLDTNFWLSTHVVCIATGYSASLAAALFAHVHVVSRVFGWRRADPAFHQAVARMGYGVLCFALLFSLVGTILGGIWANESWGRFWGWDTKENGALLICLVQIATLHARMGGILRPLGVSIATIFCGCVVAFSWWGVNLLGVGLHAYGFTKGLWTGLIVFWAFEVVVMAAGMLRASRDASEREATKLA
jgi:ABC-type transport system involved in cytochrome c biogenesis permease subunit